MNKKLSVLIILILICMPFVLAEDYNSVTGLPNQDPNEFTGNVQANLSSTWNNFLNNIHNFVLNNKAGLLLDKFFKDSNLLIRILFGQDYSFSSGLLFVILLWLYVAIKTSRGIYAAWQKRKFFCYLLGFGFAIILAQAQILRLFIVFLGIIINARQELWWVIPWAVILTILLIWANDGVNWLVNWGVKKLKKTDEKKAELTRKKLEKFADEALSN